MAGLFAGNGLRNGNQLIYNQNPLFVNANTGNLRLSTGSAAIDAGAPTFSLSMDLEGNARMGNVDLGCYAFGQGSYRLAETEGAAAEPFSATLFPNPITGAFTVSFDREITGFVQVFDMQGSLVESAQLNGANQVFFELGSQPSGIYLVRIVSGNDVLTKQVVMKKP